MITVDELRSDPYKMGVRRILRTKQSCARQEEEVGILSLISFATVEKKMLNPFAISDDSVTDTPLIFISDISADLDDLS